MQLKPDNNSWYTYILRCRDGTFYTGISNNVEARLQQHNSGKGAVYTRGRRPVKLIYSETFVDHSQAAKREYALKQLTRKQKLNLIKDWSANNES